MAIAFFPFKLTDYELAAYELSNIFIKEGYMTDVIGDEDGFTTLIYREHFHHHLLGTPAMVKATFTSKDDGTAVEVTTATGKIDGAKVIKDTLMVITVLPLIGKIAEIQVIKKKVKKMIGKVVQKYKETKDK